MIKDYIEIPANGVNLKTGVWGSVADTSKPKLSNCRSQDCCSSMRTTTTNGQQIALTRTHLEFMASRSQDGFFSKQLLVIIGMIYDYGKTFGLQPGVHFYINLGNLPYTFNCDKNLLKELNVKPILPKIFAKELNSMFPSENKKMPFIINDEAERSRVTASYVSTMTVGQEGEPNILSRFKTSLDDAIYEDFLNGRYMTIRWTKEAPHHMRYAHFIALRRIYYKYQDAGTKTYDYYLKNHLGIKKHFFISQSGGVPRIIAGGRVFSEAVKTPGLSDLDYDNLYYAMMANSYSYKDSFNGYYAFLDHGTIVDVPTRQKFMRGTGIGMNECFPLKVDTAWYTEMHSAYTLGGSATSERQVHKNIPDGVKVFCDLPLEDKISLLKQPKPSTVFCELGKVLQETGKRKKDITSFYFYIKENKHKITDEKKRATADELDSKFENIAVQASLEELVLRKKAEWETLSSFVAKHEKTKSEILKEINKNSNKDLTWIKAIF